MNNKDITHKKHISKIKILVTTTILLCTICLSGCVYTYSLIEPRKTLQETGTFSCSTATPNNNTESNTLAENNGNTLKVHFIDVGQGDSIFIQQGDKTMLIDAGERDQGSTVTRYLNSLKIDNIDYLIGTHPHSDHIGGMSTVINSISVSSAIIPDAEHDTKTYETFIDTLIEKEIDTIPAEAGNTYSLGNAEFEILGPVRNYYDDMNNWSVVIKLTFGEKSFLFTGDAESIAETDMIKSNCDLSADVLKVGHHGSTTSTSLKFLKKVSPTYAVISCGMDNSYGHPDPIITKRLKYSNVTTYETYKSGTITAECDGKNITFQTER